MLSLNLAPNCPRRSPLVLLLLMDMAMSQAGAQQAGGSPAAEQVASPRTVTAVRVTESPRIDGRLDDGAWALATGGGPLTQVTPREGTAPTERTEFRMLYDSEYLYIGVWCFDGDAARIVAAEMARDGKIDADDHIVVVLDTFLDRRNGYQFRVNPNGAREDSLIANNADLNSNWDGIWTARATIDEKGWYCEIAIPFRTISFRRDAAAWGFNVARVIKRKYEEDRWSGASEHLKTHAVSEAGLLTGLAGLKQGIGLEVTPYAIGKFRDERQRDDTDASFDAGIDARYSISPSLTANLSYNTDFAETEVDARQINFTRFPLFFPEKRDFFLQDAGIFEFGGLSSDLIPFFSRRIGLSSAGEVVPITIAAKLTGRAGGFNLGILDALVDEHDGLPMRNAFAGRVSRNVFRSSSAGAILTYGDPNSSDDNLLAGFDFNYRDTQLLENWTIQGSAFGLGTWTEGLPGSGNLAIGGKLAGESDLVVTNVTIYELGEKFNPALGFVPRRGIRTYEGELTFRPLIRSVDWLRRIWVSYFNRYITDLGNDLETALHSLTPIYLQFESGDEIFINTQLHFDAPAKDFEIHPGIIIPPDDYWFPVFRAGFISASKRPVEGSFIYDFGDFYDGTKSTYNLEVGFKPFKHLSLGSGYQLNQVRLPEGDFDTRLASVRAQVNFTPDLIWFHFLQYDDLLDSIGLNSRLQWEFRPGSFIYLVLNQISDRNHGRIRAEETDLAAKIAIAIRF